VILWLYHFTHALNEARNEPERNMNAIAKAAQAAQNYTNFLAASVGRGINTLEEFSILVEWSEAIDAAIALCLDRRDFAGDAEFCMMKDECNMYLDLCTH
jgi:hypothetical protein